MDDDLVISIPSHFQAHADVLSQSLQTALKESGAGADEIMVVRPEVKNLTLGGVDVVLLYIGSGAVTWLTKKWLDTYVWPIIKEKIDKDSLALMEWLRREVEVNTDSKGGENKVE